MENLINIIKDTKEKYGSKLILMVGSIANPKAYLNLAKAGADYIRVGVGNGSVCLTSQQTGVGYPMASLIRECYEMKFRLKCLPEYAPKIVTDGGLKKYADIMKALALGADYVLLGGILNKTMESAGDTFIGNKKHDSWTEPGEKINQYDEKYLEMFNYGTKFYKIYRGMSTKEIQSSVLHKSKLQTSEGVKRLNEVEYSLKQWVDNFKDYLQSAMSYTGKKNLKQFIGNVKYNFITQNALKRFEK